MSTLPNGSCLGVRYVHCAEPALRAEQASFACHQDGRLIRGSVLSAWPYSKGKLGSALLEPGGHNLKFSGCRTNPNSARHNQAPLLRYNSGLTKRTQLTGTLSKKWLPSSSRTTALAQASGCGVNTKAGRGPKDAVVRRSEGQTRDRCRRVSCLGQSLSSLGEKPARGL